MELGVIGLGRMGGNMARRLMKGGHEVVAYDRDADAVAKLAADGAIAATSLDDVRGKLDGRAIWWVMLPAGEITEATVDAIAEHATEGDVVIDGGNSFYKDDIRRAKKLAEKGIDYVDVGTSGGVWGKDRGYCMMIGGREETLTYLDPIFETLAPGRGDIPRTPYDRPEGDDWRAEKGFIHAGPPGAGHFVKMVHNGIEYGLMAAYAEGLNILKHANVGKAAREVDAETTPLRHPEEYQYDIDLAGVTEVWRRGSVIASWLLDLTAISLLESPDLADFGGRVSDSGEGRWTIQAAIDEGVPAHVLSAALYDRFASRGEGDFANKLLSAMRFQFGGHHEKPAK